jgi:predicted nucleic acid-binding protein
MNELVVLDNTVLSNFALVKRVDLVLSLWSGKASTTSAVLGEYLAASDKTAFPPDVWQAIRVLELTVQEESFANQLSLRLGAGERSCIAVARLRGGLFVSDDADARRIAREYAIPLSGTLGILSAGVQKNLLGLQQANQLLTLMVAAGYRSPVSKLKLPER